MHCRNWDNEDDRDRLEEIKKVIPVLKEAGVYPHLNIETHYEDTPFGPDAIKTVSKKFRVRENRIMIGSIHHFHDFEYFDLGGVRIII